MSDDERTAILDALYSRWDELPRIYQHHRKRVDEVVTCDYDLNETVRDYFASGQAALEQALGDVVISLQEHAALSRVFTAFHAYAIDLYSDCCVGFMAKLQHPLGEEAAAYDIEAYLCRAEQVRDDLMRRQGEVSKWFELALDARGLPHPTSTAGTLRFAVSDGLVDQQTALLVGCYFEVFTKVVEVLEFGLEEIAAGLAEVVGMAPEEVERLRRSDGPTDDLDAC